MGLSVETSEIHRLYYNEPKVLSLAFLS
jgi:hypothetical protein